LTRDAEQQKYSEIAALVSVTVSRERLRNAEPRFYTAWVKIGSGGARTARPFCPQQQKSSGRRGTSEKRQHVASNVAGRPKEKAARRRLSILIIVDQAAINAGFDFGRWAALADNDF
jgi:hypothetical protein